MRPVKDAGAASADVAASASDKPADAPVEGTPGDKPPGDKPPGDKPTT